MWVTRGAGDWPQVARGRPEVPRREVRFAFTGRARAADQERLYLAGLTY